MDPCKKEGDIAEAIQLGKSAHHRLDEHKERMDKLEDNNKILHEMNTNIKLMVQQNSYRDTKVEGIEEDVKEIKGKPQKSFEKYKAIVISVVLTAITMAILLSLPTIISNIGK